MSVTTLEAFAMLPSEAVAATAGVLGLFIGSFLNVCIDRYVAGESIVYPPSHCTHCGHRLGAADLIPVLSWLMLGGKCRYCRHPLSPAYPVSELATAVVFALTALHFGAGLETLAALVFAALFIVMSGIDLRIFILPDRLTYPTAVLALPAAVWIFGHSWLDAALGGIVGAGVFWLLARYYRWRTGRDGLGLGDVKLMLSIGFLCGLEHLALAVLLASAAALAGFGIMAAAGRKGVGSARLPFGPFLCGAAWITLVYGGSLWALWLDIVL